MEITKFVKQRNKPLSKLLTLLLWRNYLWLFYHSGDYDVRKHAPKRGRKGYVIPLKFVMNYLGVTHRTAQDYIRTVEALDKLDKLFDVVSQIPYEYARTHGLTMPEEQRKKVWIPVPSSYEEWMKIREEGLI